MFSKTAFSGLLIAPAILISLHEAAAQTLIPDAPTCPTCRIEIETVTRLGEVDGPGAILGFSRDIAIDRQGRYWLAMEDAPPMLFDANGKFLRSIGRKGNGPGEFVYAITLLVLPGDSMLIIDPQAQRASVIGPDLRFTRSVRLPTGDYWEAMLFQWPGHVTLNGMIGTRAGASAPLHSVALGGTDAALLRSFGGDGSQVAGSAAPPLRRLSAPRSNAAWSADFTHYRLAKWSSDGSVLQQLERRPSWFAQPSNAFSIGSRDRPPPPRIAAVSEDSAGRVWVFVHTARPTWQKAWSEIPRMPSGASGDMNASRMPAGEALWRTTIEIIDPKAGRVVSSVVTDHFIIATLPGNRVAAYRSDADGVPYVTVLRLQVRS